ncbi:MAG: OmpH family outer membrane protein, partial [Bacteroidales bacterium]
FTFAACKQNDKADTHPKGATAPGAYTIAFVDTDTLFENYLMVVDVKKELDATEKKLTSDYKNQITAFQREYENYLKVGASMTLSEQKKKEEYLGKKQQSLAQLESKYGEQLMAYKAQKNEEVQNAIFEFIEKYNKDHGNYTMIFSKARTSGVLYSEPSMDITAEVLKAINAAYKPAKK